MKILKSVTGLSNLIHQTKLTEETEYVDVKKLVKSDQIICIQFENPQISSTGLSNLIDQTNLTDDLLNTSMLKNF